MISVKSASWRRSESVGMLESSGERQDRSREDTEVVILYLCLWLCVGLRYIMEPATAIDDVSQSGSNPYSNRA